MMFTPPFFGFPNYYPHSYSNYNMYNKYKKPYSQLYSNLNNCKNEEHSNTNKHNTKEISPPSEDRNYFEIMGIKLYFDDILLICLIFFLYNEGVQDEMLFMALILLLLS